MISDCVRTAGRAAAATLGVLGMVGASATTGAAQPADPRPTARMHVGPLYLTPRLVLQDVGFDSNVFNSVDDPEADFTFTVTPELSVASGFRRVLLTGRSATDFVYFATHQTERSVNQDLVGGARVSFRRIAVFAEASYLNTRRRPNEEIDARARRVERASEAGIDVRLSPKLSAQFSGRQAVMEFDADAIFDDTRLAETLNRETRSARVAVRYAVTPLTALVTSGEVRETRFTRSPVRDSDSWHVLQAIELQPRALVSGRVQLGYRRLLPLNVALPEFTGPVGSVDVAYRLRETTILGASLDRDLGYSYAPQEPYYVSEGYGVSARRRLTARLDVEVRVQRVWYRYRRFEPAADVAGTGGRTDRIRRDSVTLGYRMSSRTRLSLGLSYWERRSDQRDLRNFDGLRLNTTVAYGF